MIERKYLSIHSEYVIKKEFRMEIGHRIWNQELPDGMECKCKNLHGHQIKIVLSLISGYLNKQGMVIDFNIIKKFISEYKQILDHKFLIDENDPLYKKLNSLDVVGVVGLSYSPTAENMAHFTYDWFKRLEKYHNVYLKSVEWYETDTASCMYSEKKIR